MCGIAGIMNRTGKPVSLDELQRMCDAMTHRGPDDDGYYLGNTVGMGMRRLSIIDLDSGRQPIHNEDLSVWVVFNGEIYNFKTLRAELQAAGHAFCTETDTEVIVHLYEQYGESCVERLRGMFAFALWDERRRTLLVARDRLGIKPLYWTEAGGRLAFGSELKVLLQLPEIERRLNYNSVSHLFSSLSTPLDESIIEGVHKLPPGHLLTASPQGPARVRQYWDVRFAPEQGRDEGYFAERLRGLLEESVALHMVSDVPLGAFLSGGIDSSSVVATMARLSPRPVKTFSIGFGEPEYNELEYARAAAKRFGTDHHELVLEPDVMGVLDDLPWYLDEPFGDSSAIPTYMVSKLAARDVTVVLSGDGGDELFAGYDRYLVEQKQRTRDAIPAPLRMLAGLAARLMPEGMKGRNFLRHLALTGPRRYLDSGDLFGAHGKRKLFQHDVRRLLAGYDARALSAGLLEKADGHWLSALQYLDLKTYLPNDILTKVDRMSMAHSIEARVPLLDHPLVEFAATIPPEMHLRGAQTKRIFKKAMEGILPPEILHRPKKGFAIPLDRWFRGTLGGFVRDLLLAPACRQRGLFDARYIERLVELNDRGRNMDLQLWTLISFELWCKRFLDRAVVLPDRLSDVERAPVAA